MTGRHSLSIDLPSRKTQIPKVSPERANALRTSLLSNFLSPPICMILYLTWTPFGHQNPVPTNCLFGAESLQKVFQKPNLSTCQSVWRALVEISTGGLRINLNLVEEKLLQGIKIGLIRIAPIRPLRIRDSKRNERNKRPDDVQQ